jgi:hypothetical protein
LRSLASTEYRLRSAPCAFLPKYLGASSSQFNYQSPNEVVLCAKAKLIWHKFCAFGLKKGQDDAQ